MLTANEELIRNLRLNVRLDYFIDAEEHIFANIKSQNSKLLEADNLHKLFVETAKLAVAHKFAATVSLEKLLTLRLAHKADLNEYSGILQEYWLTEEAKVWVISVLVTSDPHKLNLGELPFKDFKTYPVDQRRRDMAELEQVLQKLPPDHSLMFRRAMDHQGYFMAIVRQELEPGGWKPVKSDLRKGIPYEIAGVDRRLSFIGNPQFTQLEIDLDNSAGHLKLNVPALHVTEYYHDIIKIINSYCIKQASAEEVRTCLEAEESPNHSGEENG